MTFRSGPPVLVAWVLLASCHRSPEAAPNREQAQAAADAGDTPAPDETDRTAAAGAGGNGAVLDEGYAEYHLRVLPPLAEWDADQDRRLTRSEFASGLFAWWDGDGSGEIDVFEFRSRADPWLEQDLVLDRFKSWDADSSGLLSRAELFEGSERDRIFERWDDDGDGTIGDDEVTYVLYRGWDIDGDDDADIEEWQTW